MEKDFKEERKARQEERKEVERRINEYGDRLRAQDEKISGLLAELKRIKSAPLVWERFTG